MGVIYTVINAVVLAQPGFYEADAAKIHGIDLEKAGAVASVLQIVYEVRPVGGIGKTDHRAKGSPGNAGGMPPTRGHEGTFTCFYNDAGRCGLCEERVFFQIRMVYVDDLGETGSRFPVEPLFLIGGINDDLFVPIVLGDEGVNAEVVDMQIWEYSASAEIHFDVRFAIEPTGD